MPTIKDVAAAAGVSPTTVSLVMNGRGEQHRIPPETIIRIQNAMRELGYQPNLSARRLRTSAERRPVVAFFWPLDYRANMLGYFHNATLSIVHYSQRILDMRKVSIFKSHIYYRSHYLYDLSFIHDLLLISASSAVPLHRLPLP